MNERNHMNRFAILSLVGVLCLAGSGMAQTWTGSGRSSDGSVRVNVSLEGFQPAPHHSSTPSWAMSDAQYVQYQHRSAIEARWRAGAESRLQRLAPAIRACNLPGRISGILKILPSGLGKQILYDHDYTRPPATLSECVIHVMRAAKFPRYRGNSQSPRGASFAFPASDDPPIAYTHSATPSRPR
jgi:hypothetical protein